jgi:hypothetical protein
MTYGTTLRANANTLNVRPLRFRRSGAGVRGRARGPADRMGWAQG